MDELQSFDCTLSSVCKLTSQINPNIASLQLGVLSSSYAVDMLESDFDPTIFSTVQLNRAGLNLNELDPRSQVAGNLLNTNTYQLSSGIQKRLTGGTTVSAGMEFFRTSDNIPLNAYNEYVGDHVGANSTAVNVAISQPLLRGKGESYNTAPIELSKIQVKTDQLSLVHNASELMQNVVIAYWQYLAESQRLKIYNTNVRRVNSVLEMTEELVLANKKPRSDLIQIQADLLGKERQALIAKQNLFSARQTLARFIGMSKEESLVIGDPSDGFPDVTADNLIQLEDLIMLSLENRNDLQAINQQISKTEVLASMAEHETKPSLDLTGSIQYGGSDLGNGIHRILTPLTTNDGRNYSLGIGLRYNIPIGNNRAESNVLIRDNNVTNQYLVYNNQQRNIEINLSIEYNSLLNSIDALDKAKRTLEYYEEVFDNEQLKFQNGLTTILNLIIFQERLTFAQLDYITNQQQVANSIVRLRHQTGTLLSTDLNSLNIVSTDVFYQLPIR